MALLWATQAGRSRNARHCGRIPLASQRLRLWCIKAHGEVERSLWRWQPVGLSILARIFILEVQDKRAIRVVLERHPAADGEAVERVCNLVALGIVKCH